MPDHWKMASETALKRGFMQIFIMLPRLYVSRDDCGATEPDWAVARSAFFAPDCNFTRFRVAGPA
jgi:hypothetical protein